MPINSQAHVLLPESIKFVPDEPGVYSLEDDRNVVIYYGGTTDSVKGRLQRHHNGDEGPCTQLAIFFRYQIDSVTPMAREKILIAEHIQKFGRKPKCNEVIPS